VWRSCHSCATLHAEIREDMIMSAPEFSNPSTVVKPVGAYSHVGLIKAGSDVLYIAGQVGLTPDGQLGATLAEQAEEAFHNVLRILEASGMTTANLVKVNIYLVMGQSAVETRTARLKYFGDARPASTFVFVPQLIEPKYLIEIEGVAAR